MRRLALLVAGGALWLLVTALPVMADGGPHSKAANAGTGGLSGDCAACHRAHTAQAADLLKVSATSLCLSCHDGTGATTDVVDGYQYVPSGTGTPTTQVLGALRGGGFSYALIDAGSAARVFNTRPSLARGHVGVLAATAKQAVTSTHGGTGGTVWGNGPISAAAQVGAGPVDMDCAACHNPHGNGQYRILQTRPGEDWAAEGVAAWVAPTSAVEVQDGPALTGTQVRNYTVLPGNLATDVTATAAQGDYWRRHVPSWNVSLSRDPLQTGWDGLSPTNAAASGGTPLDNRTGLLTAWCVSCHTRYSGTLDLNSGLTSDAVPSGDAVYMYRHDTSTATGVGCEQCHVSHGTNVLMTSLASLGEPNPDGAVPPTVANAGTGSTVSGDSRLLKVANRGTCQMCHDPTNTVGTGTYVGPSPTPGAP